MSTPWTPELDGWNRSRFEAYAKLLGLKNGRQIEEASDFTEIATGEADSADLESTSVNVDILSSHFSEDKLKRAFLDRLSELVANKKYGRHVSSSLMIDWPDRVDVLVAKNTGIKENDSQSLKNLAASLRDISRLNRGDINASEILESFWISLIQSYEPRLRAYILEAKQVLNKTSLRASRVEAQDPDSDGYQSSLTSRLDKFRAFVNDATSLSTHKGLGEAVERAYDIYHLWDQQEHERITDKTSNDKSLKNALGFLGRLETCFKTFIRVAERLPNFQNLQIFPVRIKSKKRNPVEKWSIERTFSSLGLRLNDKTIKAILPKRKIGQREADWTKTSLISEFADLKLPSSEVHAEVQVTLGAMQHDCTGASIFQYVGCSRRSCFLCFRFTEDFVALTTRGCHGKIYDLWTMPEVTWLAREERSRLVKHLNNLEEDMKSCSLSKNHKRIDLVKESTIGGSSLATVRVRPHVDNPYTMSLALNHLQAQREETSLRSKETEASEYQSANVLNEDGIDITGDPFFSAESQDQSFRTLPAAEMTVGECMICERETCRRCGYCSLDWFCSERCQVQMSFNHLTKCSARSITTSDILLDDVIRDTIPADPQTREDFGFDRCRNKREESHLLGLYIGFLRRVPDSAKNAAKLNEWQQKGLLIEKIINKFSTLPENSRGAYFPWFLRNQHILDNSMSQLQSNPRHDALLQISDAARTYLEPEDRNKEIKDLMPPEKKYCFLFYAMVLDSGTPHPSWLEVDFWYDFGFAVCTDEYHERSLGALYNKLLGGNKIARDYDESLGIESNTIPSSPVCSFAEFWRAWRSGSIADLFDRYDMSNDLDMYTKSMAGFSQGFPHLRGFMSSSPEERPSVWRLRHLLALDENTPLQRYPEIQKAAKEYGFTSQLDARTAISLRHFYRNLLQAGDPLEVHKAKDGGRLLKYAEKQMTDIDDRVRDVLQKLDSRNERRG